MVISAWLFLSQCPWNHVHTHHDPLAVLCLIMTKHLPLPRFKHQPHLLFSTLFSIFLFFHPSEKHCCKTMLSLPTPGMHLNSLEWLPLLIICTEHGGCSPGIWFFLSSSVTSVQKGDIILTIETGPSTIYSLSLSFWCIYYKQIASLCHFTPPLMSFVSHFYHSIFLM